MAVCCWRYAAGGAVLVVAYRHQAVQEEHGGGAFSQAPALLSPTALQWMRAYERPACDVVSASAGAVWQIKAHCSGYCSRLACARNNVLVCMRSSCVQTTGTKLLRFCGGLW
mmetsp:Transcript_4273/g.12300  ORF Transcript_4273/g.12300 Transcript_4273/m.12300 type:complete len:112 (-) Transcript_4273:1974-2309(-)